MYANTSIYKWNDNQLEKFQEIGINQVMASTTVVINNKTFIVFAHRYNCQLRFSVHSTVYKWLGNKFVKLQSLQTYGARDVKSFIINGSMFLAFANERDGRSYNINSFIYNGMAESLFCFRLSPLVELASGIHL